MTVFSPLWTRCWLLAVSLSAARLPLDVDREAADASTIKNSDVTKLDNASYQDVMTDCNDDKTPPLLTGDSKISISLIAGNIKMAQPQDSSLNVTAIESKGHVRVEHFLESDYIESTQERPSDVTMSLTQTIGNIGADVIVDTTSSLRAVDMKINVEMNDHPGSSDCQEEYLSVENCWKNRQEKTNDLEIEQTESGSSGGAANGSRDTVASHANNLPPAIEEYNDGNDNWSKISPNSNETICNSNKTNSDSNETSSNETICNPNKTNSDSNETNSNETICNPNKTNSDSNETSSNETICNPNRTNSDFNEIISNKTIFNSNKLKSNFSENDFSSNGTNSISSEKNASFNEPISISKDVDSKSNVTIYKFNSSETTSSSHETNNNSTETNPSSYRDNSNCSETNSSSYQNNSNRSESNPSSFEASTYFTKTNSSFFETNSDCSETNSSFYEANTDCDRNNSNSKKINSESPESKSNSKGESYGTERSMAENRGLLSAGTVVKMRAVVSMITILVCIIGILLNISSVLVFHSLASASTNSYMACLVVLDTISLIVALILTVVQMVYGSQSSLPPAFVYFRLYVGLTLLIGMRHALYIVTCLMTVDRFLALVCTMKMVCQNPLRHARAVTGIVTVLVNTFTISDMTMRLMVKEVVDPVSGQTSYLIQPNPDMLAGNQHIFSMLTLVTNVFLRFIPVFIILSLNVGLYLALIHHSRRMKVAGIQNHIVHRREIKMMRSVRAVLLFSFVFLVLGFPYTCIQIVDTASPRWLMSEPQLLEIISVLLPLLDVISSAIDFFIFFAVNINFRKGIKTLICRA